MRVKLIRDKMKISQGGRTAAVNSLPGKHIALIAKLHEEAEEIAKKATDPEEYADLLEVLLELAHINQVPWANIERAMLQKRQVLGGFRFGKIWISKEVQK